MKESQFLSASIFFGLTLKTAGEFRKSLFTQIHNIVYHGNGGYDWYTVYNMPIWLRKFTFKEINDFIKAENKRMEKANKGNSSSKNILDSSGKIKPPKFSSAFKNTTGYK